MRLFHENMTVLEAQSALYDAVKGKDKEERERIFVEYEKVLPAIIHRELHEYDGKGAWLTSYH